MGAEVAAEVAGWIQDLALSMLAAEVAAEQRHALQQRLRHHRQARHRREREDRDAREQRRRVHAGRLARDEDDHGNCGQAAVLAVAS